VPYKIEKRGTHWEVINKDTKKSKGKSVSKEKAEAHMRALYAAEGMSKALEG
jgi:hypothetical protein